MAPLTHCPRCLKPTASDGALLCGCDFLPGSRRESPVGLAELAAETMAAIVHDAAPRPGDPAAKLVPVIVRTIDKDDLPGLVRTLTAIAAALAIDHADALVDTFDEIF